MAEFNPQTENLLDLSVEKYHELLQHGKNLLRMLDDCDYSQVTEYTIKMQDLQAEASKQDEILLPLLKTELQVWQKHTLYQKRFNYISSIIKLNELLKPKIKGAMAVTSAELDQIRGSRTAFAGYSVQDTNTGGHRGTG